MNETKEAKAQAYREALTLVIEEHEKWEQTHGEEGHRLDLSGKHLPGAYFSGANFSGAVLEGTSFKGALLPGADFSGALTDESTKLPKGWVRENPGVDEQIYKSLYVDWREDNSLDPENWDEASYEWWLLNVGPDFITEAFKAWASEVGN